MKTRHAGPAPAVHFWEFHDLSSLYQNMIRSAGTARKRAYAPYSDYLVGAAVLNSRKRIYSGCNVETSTYNSLHAERNAIGHMVAAEGPRNRIKVVAVIGASRQVDTVSWTNDPQINTPEGSCSDVCPSCAACLQDIWEFCHGDASVELLHVFPEGDVAITSIGEAYPLRFGPADLGIGVPRLR